MLLIHIGLLSLVLQARAVTPMTNIYNRLITQNGVQASSKLAWVSILKSVNYTHEPVFLYIKIFHSSTNQSNTNDTTKRTMLKNAILIENILLLLSKETLTMYCLKWLLFFFFFFFLTLGVPLHILNLSK